MNEGSEGSRKDTPAQGEMAPPDAAPGTLQAVDRTLRLLCSLADSPRSRTLQELSDIMGCSVSSVHRMLSTLAEFHLVEKDPLSRRYRVGLGVFRLAESRAQQTDLRLVARPHMEWLSDYSLETVCLYGLRAPESICIDVTESRQELRLVVAVGSSTRLSDLGAKSKALLAWLDPAHQDAILDEVRWEQRGLTPASLRDELRLIRAQGMARSFGERLPSAASMAAPIFDHRGKVMASLAIAGPRERWTPERMDNAQQALRSAAQQIGAELGYRGAGEPGLTAIPPRP